MFKRVKGDALGPNDGLRSLGISADCFRSIRVSSIRGLVLFWLRLLLLHNTDYYRFENNPVIIWSDCTPQFFLGELCENIAINLILIFMWLLKKTTTLVCYCIYSNLDNPTPRLVNITKKANFFGEVFKHGKMEEIFELNLNQYECRILEQSLK